MKGLDTNILVRYLTQDEPDQAARAVRFIEKASADNRLLINSVVLCELVWVLESAYDFHKEIIVDVLEKIFATSQFEIEDKSTAWSAFNDSKHNKADFADCLIGRENIALGCSETMTFDKRLKGLEGFKLL